LNSTSELIEALGSFSLVARCVGGSCRGVVWRAGAKVGQAEGHDLEHVMEQLRQIAAKILRDHAVARGGAEPSTEEFESAFARVLPKLHTNQLRMLQAHYRAPARTLTATQLAQAAGYSSYSSANVHYGRVGWLLYGELPCALPEREGKPVYTFMLADGTDLDRTAEGEWTWQMRGTVASALEHLGIVKTRAGR